MIGDFDLINVTAADYTVGTSGEILPAIAKTAKILFKPKTNSTGELILPTAGNYTGNLTFTVFTQPAE